MRGYHCWGLIFAERALAMSVRGRFACKCVVIREGNRSDPIGSRGVFEFCFLLLCP